MLGLAGESGEVFELIKRHYRDGVPFDREKLKKEVGDVLWYVAMLATDLGLSLDEIAAANVAKLRDRASRGVIHGSGGDR